MAAARVIPIDTWRTPHRADFCPCPFHDLDAIARRFPLLLRSMKWAAILCDTEARASIRDFKHGHGSGEAVSHFGGPLEVIRAGIRCRTVVRKIWKGEL